MAYTPTFLVEAAMGADVSADPATWTWTPITSYVRGRIQITRGRPDLATGQPTQGMFRLDNDDSRFTPWHTSSPYWGQWLRGTPVRVWLNPSTGPVLRLYGYVAKLEPVWPSGNSGNAEVVVTVAGALRRLGQGSVLRSALIRSMLTPTPIAAWALDDGSASTIAASLIGGSAMSTTSGTPTFEADAGTLAGTGAVVQLPDGSAIAGTVGTYTATGFLAFSYWLQPSAQVVQSQTAFGTATLSGGGITGIQFFAANGIGQPPGFVATMVDSTGATWSADTGLGSPGSPLNPYDNWHNCFLTLTVSGSDTIARLYIDGVLGDTKTIVGFTPGVLTSVRAQSQTVAAYPTGTNSVAGIAAWANVTAAPAAQAGTGYTGELASARVTRLCTEQKVPVTVTGTSTVTMGPQSADEFVALLRECETADQGILRDGLTAGVTYLAGAARCNPAAAMALDTKRGHVKLPFAPVEDDARTRNDITATRPDGSSARFVDSAAADPLSTVRIGVYDDEVQVNVATDGALLHQAGWRVHLGTVSEMRIPQLSIMPSDAAEIVASWLASDIGARYTVANLPSQYPARQADQVLEYYAETFDKVTWTVQLVGSPASVWRVSTIENLLRGRLDTAGSQLASSVTTTATSWSVATTSGPLWNTTAAPFDIKVDSEQVTVTAISGASSPQTFTVTRSVNGVVAAHLANAAVSLWQPAVLAL